MGKAEEDLMKGVKTVSARVRGSSANKLIRAFGQSGNSLSKYLEMRNILTLLTSSSVQPMRSVQDAE